MTNEESTITITKEQKAILSEGIIDGTLKMLKRTTWRESARKCARHDSSKYKQSETTITDNTISINILTDYQGLPAQPRDFRRRLNDEENKIGMAELSDVLSSICRRHLLKRTGSNVSYPRGRPSKNADPNDERRGRTSYYDKSRIKQIIDEVLSDRESFIKIDHAISNSEVFFKHRQYSIEVALHQMKENEKKFLNTYQPVFRRYGIKQKGSGGEFINEKGITDDMIKKLAARLALDTKPTENEKKGIYTAGGIIYFDELMRMQDQSTC